MPLKSESSVCCSLLRNRNVRSFMIGYTIYTLVLNVSYTLLPLLVVQKFGAGSALVSSLALRVLPQVIFAPFIRRALLKKGPRLIAGILIFGIASIRFLLPHITHYRLFQGLILLLGVISTGVSTSLLVLRSQVTPQGENIPFNTLFARMERLSQLLGPSFAGLLLYSLTVVQCFYGIGIALLSAGMILLAGKDAQATSATIESKSTNASYRGLLQLFQQKPILWLVFIPALSYAVLLGGLKPFLLWSTTQTFHNPASSWSLLLTAHGMGAGLGSLLAPMAVRWSTQYFSLPHTYLGVGMIKTIWLISLAWVPHFSWAMGLLFIAGIPEVIGSICFYTLLQKNLSYPEEATFHTFSLPIFSTFLVGGTLLGELYTLHWFSLQTFWIVTITVSMLLILLPTFLFPIDQSPTSSSRQ